MTTVPPDTPSQRTFLYNYDKTDATVDPDEYTIDGGTVAGSPPDHQPLDGGTV